MKKNKIIIVIIGLLIIGAIVYFLIKKKKAASLATSGASVSSGSSSSASTSAASVGASVFPLKKGSTGPEVKQVQKYLNQKYNAGLATDGIWGPKTDAAVTQYLQRDNISSDIYQKWGLASI